MSTAGEELEDVMTGLPAPFPWFGGKSRAAALVWERFGAVRNYVEPFFGSGAVLLQRPTAPGIETVNDADAYLTNFWRALKRDPVGVAEAADWPVNEVDLAARRDRLFSGAAEFRARMWTEPEYYDAGAAGVWLWGVCSTIGNAWQPKSTHRGNAGMGIHRASTHLGDAGMGIHRAGTHLGNAGRGIRFLPYLEALSARLRNVRVMCGDWSRVTSPTVTSHNGLTGVFLDPPYEAEGQDGLACYTEGEKGITAEVRAWAIERGKEADMRIALCGYADEHEMPEGWECVAWHARKGYQGADKAENRHRERIWFSPACLRVDLF